MHQMLDIFRLADGLARHAGARQAVVARNVAHADTPGYHARDIEPFTQSYLDRGPALGLRTERPGHLPGRGRAEPASLFEAPGPAAPNGNTVSLETEMMKAVRTRQQHDMALSVYGTALGILRTSLGRGR